MTSCIVGVGLGAFDFVAGLRGSAVDEAVVVPAPEEHAASTTSSADPSSNL